VSTSEIFVLLIIRNIETTESTTQLLTMTKLVKTTTLILLALATNVHSLDIKVTSISCDNTLPIIPQFTTLCNSDSRCSMGTSEEFVGVGKSLA
jgi:hypothetical protein